MNNNHPHFDVGCERRALKPDGMRAFRWTGTHDRITVEIEHEGVTMTLELGVLDAHVEPDEADRIFDVVSRETPAPGSVAEFAVLKFCRHINGS
tara:strand:- start:6244 stop:6525 length:282 start_codon:yes stop_codon:yes gene_type:complete